MSDGRKIGAEKKRDDGQTDSDSETLFKRERRKISFIFLYFISGGVT